MKHAEHRLEARAEAAKRMKKMHDSEAGDAYEEAKKKPLGEGSRFKAVAEEAGKGGAKDPEAVAAAAGMKKYGKAKMAAMSAAGRK